MALCYSDTNTSRAPAAEKQTATQLNEVYTKDMAVTAKKLDYLPISHSLTITTASALGLYYLKQV